MKLERKNMSPLFALFLSLIFFVKKSEHNKATACKERRPGWFYVATYSTTVTSVSSHLNWPHYPSKSHDSQTRIVFTL